MQLVGRHWVITDGVGKVETVSGLGVVGQQPVLNPGDTFRYTSGCPLTTASGVMSGHYRMTDQSGNGFEVEIPAFSLDSPYLKARAQLGIVAPQAHNRLQGAGSLSSSSMSPSMTPSPMVQNFGSCASRPKGFRSSL